MIAALRLDCGCAQCHPRPTCYKSTSMQLQLGGRASDLTLAHPRQLLVTDGRCVRSLSGVEQVPSTFAEDLDKSLFTPATYVQENALVKAREVWAKLHAEAELDPGKYRPVDMVIGSDTVVSVDDRILEKPKDADAAMAMLSSLSGRRHRVYSGVAMLHRCADDASSTPFSTPPDLDPASLGVGSCYEQAFVECTEVEFAELSEAEITAYVATGEPYDKAGGYGIQAAAGAFVKGIHGDYYNVMGLPLHKVAMTIATLVQ